jgi:putative phosphoesterase
MKIAVLSDIHDHLENLEKTLRLVKEQRCEAIIFCGDFCAPFIAPKLTGPGLPVYAVLGNNDEDQWAIVRNIGAATMTVIPLADEFGEVELDKRLIAFIHYPKLARGLACLGTYDAVFYGHNHQPHQEIVGKTLLANPGAVCGIHSGKPGKATFGVYETRGKTFEVYEL